MNLIRTAAIDLNNKEYHRHVTLILPEVRMRDTTSFEAIIVSRGQLWYVDNVGLRVFSRVKLDARYRDGYRGRFNYGVQSMIYDQINKLPWGESYEIS